jgi:DNA-binding transcriptional ArsR family regulator
MVREAAVLRLLADPLKLRIAEALREAPASPHELARRFGLKPTALYHHVAKLAAAGLVEVAARRRRRGAIERLYRLTARQLVVDRRLVGKRTVSTVLAAASAMLQLTSDDLHAAALDPSRSLADRDRSELATIVVRTTPAKAKQLMRELRALLATALRLDGTGTTRARLTLALVPSSMARS